MLNNVSRLTGFRFINFSVTKALQKKYFERKIKESAVFVRATEDCKNLDWCYARLMIGSDCKFYEPNPQLNALGFIQVQNH